MDWFRRATFATLLLTAGLCAAAQRVSPVIFEHKGRTESRFELTNQALVPANVIVEAQSFSVTEDGELLFRPLDDHIRVKLSAMSLRIPPKQSRFVFYEAEADQFPAWFMIHSTFGRKPVEEAVNLQFRLTHTVYLLQDEPLRKEDVSVVEARFFPDEQQVVVILENHGPRLGRVLEGDIRAGRKRHRLGNFPLFPNYRRRLVIPWEGTEGPVELRLSFDKFGIRHRFEVGENARADKFASQP